MGKGFCDAFKATEDENYLKAAIANANFIVTKLWSTEGNLYRNYKNGKATINGYLEDYAHTIDSFIALYPATLDRQWLDYAKQLSDYVFEHFYDGVSGFFSFTSNTDDKLIAPHFEIEDNVIPASNSVMASNLYKLSVYFGNPHYEWVCVQMLKQIIPSADYPSAFSNWLDVLLNFYDKQRELAICGSDALNFTLQLASRYLPNILIAGSDKQSTLPFLENRFSEGEMLFYVCQNKVCQLPVKNFPEALKILT